MNYKIFPITLVISILILSAGCERNKTDVIEEKESSTKVEEQQPEIKEPEQSIQEEPIQKEEEQEKVIEKELTEQEKTRQELVDKYGEDVVAAWEKLSKDEFFNYIGYKLVVQEKYGPYGVYYTCYKVMEDGTLEDAYVGGEYYIYGVYVSNEAIFDLVDYHNEFFS